MERSYYIPSNKLKGENRILYIFTGKSLIYTAIGGSIGSIFYFLLSAASMKIPGIIIMAVFAVIGYVIGMVKMPTYGNSKITKNVGGDSIDEIIYHYITYRKNRKVYSYAIPRKDPDYSKSSISGDLLDKMSDKVNSAIIGDDTKEEKK